MRLAFVWAAAILLCLTRAAQAEPEPLAIGLEDFAYPIPHLEIADRFHAALNSFLAK